MIAITLAFIATALAGATLTEFLGALFRIGGGMITLPLLTAFMGVPIHEGIAISIISVIATSNALTILITSMALGYSWHFTPQ